MVGFQDEYVRFMETMQPEMQAIIDEVNPVVRIPPSAALILRRMLVEGMIRDAVNAELNARLGLVDPNECDREMDKLWAERMPNWEIYEPPQLTEQQAAALELARLTNADQSPISVASAACYKIRGDW